MRVGIAVSFGDDDLKYRTNRTSIHLRLPWQGVFLTFGPPISIQGPPMPRIRELATLTSKGQLTLPKPIRQVLGITTGSQIAFELRDGEVIVTRAEIEHEDPAIGAFLGLLEADIRKGKNLEALPKELAQAMLASKGLADALDEDIESEVAL